MAKKKGPKKKRIRSADPLTPDQHQRLEAILAEPARIDTRDIRTSLPDPTIAAAFMERLPAGDPDLIPILTAVRETFEDKAVQKAVRKAAFRFEQQGVHIPLAPSREGAVLRRTDPDVGEPFAFLSPVDAMGVRGVVFGIPRAPKGIELGAALVSDENGILQYAGGTFSKKKALAARDDFLENFRHVVPATPEHAVSVLERAHRAGADAPGGAPYLEARPWILDRIVPYESPPVRGLIPVETLTDQPFTDSMATRLLQHEILTHWMADPSQVRSLAEEIQEVEESPIYLSEEQRNRRIDEVIQAWIRDHFSEPQRKQIAERLEETAYTLYHLGDEERARVACIAARSLEARDTIFNTNPLLQVMTERTLALFREGREDPAAQEQDKEAGDGKDEDHPSSGLILP